MDNLMMVLYQKDNNVEFLFHLGNFLLNLFVDVDLKL